MMVFFSVFLVSISKTRLLMRPEIHYVAPSVIRSFLGKIYRTLGELEQTVAYASFILPKCFLHIASLFEMTVVLYRAEFKVYLKPQKMGPKFHSVA